MEIKHIILIFLTIVATISIVYFLIRKNKADLKKIHPDARNAMEEIRKDQERNRDKI